MPVDLDYCSVFRSVFLRVFAPAFLALFAFRMLAASVAPCLCNKRVYWLFCLFVFTMYSFLFAIGEKEVSVFAEVLLLLLFAPGFILGAVGTSRRWRWHAVLLSFVLETLLFPLLFAAVFMASLLFDSAD